MHIIGLLGGVASGKSLVARWLGQLGAVVLDADRAGHEVLRQAEVESAARARWGDAVFAADGRLDRSRLARVVFGPDAQSAEERKYLERLTHPRIAARLQEQARERSADGCLAAVLDAPLLLEAGWDRFCDTLVFVDAPREARWQRALARGWTEEQFAAREAAQMSVEEKRRRADVVIANGGPEADARRQVEAFWRGLPARSA